jgi:Carboxypeptidase regulatory-like domain/TonB dependent receptor-like, beta-barrel
MKTAMLLFFVFCVGLASAFAQTSTGRLVGTVASSDGVISGANVTVTDDKTGKGRSVVTAGDGTFTVPQLEVGTYTVKITANGFKTFTATSVKIDIGREYSMVATLEVGQFAETVTVSAGTDVLNATTGELSNTVSSKQILELPLNGRNPMNLIALQPGVASNSAQNSSINGMRTSFTNITRDGLNIQDGFIRSNATDFAPGRPSVDDTGEFTVVTQNSGADQNGGAQVRLVTPRGENKFHGALYEFNRNSTFSANDYFSNSAGLDVPFLNRNNFGGKIGGPMPIPHFGQGGPATLTDKGFFFFSYEGLRQRSQSLRDRRILTPSARQGIFTYKDDAGATRTINLLSLAGITAIDPVVNSRILSAMPAVGNRTDIANTDNLNTTGFSFRQPNNQDRNSYVTRIDYDISEKHTINGVFTYNKENNLRPDVDGNDGFAPIPATVQSSANKLFVLAYRWTPTARLTNELRGGTFRSAVPFDRTTDKPGFFITPPAVNPSLAVTATNPTFISNPEVTFLDQGRNTRYNNFQDNAELNFGSHALRFGGQLQFQEVDATNEAGIVPNFTLGVNPNTLTLKADPFPGGISSAQLNTANALMALLGGFASTGTQSFNATSRNSGFQAVTRLEPFRYGNHSLYVQDQWRALPSLTLNLGLRYEIYTSLELTNGLALEPVIPEGTDPKQAVLNPNGAYNFLGGNAGKENRYYKTDKNNFAPVISVAYTPRNANKWLKPLVGENQLVIRGGYRRSYLNDQMITALRNAASGNVGLGTTAISATNPKTGTSQLDFLVARDLPVAIAAPNLPALPLAFSANNTGAFSNFGTVFAIDPEIQTPRVDEYNFGIQREFGANAIEIRYVGSRSNNLWRSIDFNQIDILNNGFLADFLRARSNLLLTGNAACTAAQNPGCQTLTVFPNLKNGGALTNANNLQNIRNGQPADLALAYIQGANTGTVQFLANPSTGVANLFTNGAIFRYNSLQAEFRRRFTKGLYFQANYTFQKTLSDGVGTSQTLVEPFLDNRQIRLDYSRADYDQAHLFKANGVYELPFGRGRALFGGVSRKTDLLIGGWQVNAIANVGSGAPITISDPRGTLNRAGRAGRQTAFSTLTKDQIKDLIGIRKTANGVLFIDPAVINSTGRAAGSFGSPAFDGQVFFNVAPGQTGNLDRAFINGPLTFNLDASVVKNLQLLENVKLQLRLEAFNALNRANFGVTAAQQFTLFNINSATFGRLDQASPGRIIQIGARLDF